MHERVLIYWPVQFPASPITERTLIIQLRGLTVGKTLATLRGTGNPPSVTPNVPSKTLHKTHEIIIASAPPKSPLFLFLTVNITPDSSPAIPFVNHYHFLVRGLILHKPGFTVHI